MPFKSINNSFIINHLYIAGFTAFAYATIYPTAVLRSYAVS